MDKCSHRIIIAKIDNIEYYRYCFLDENHTGNHNAYIGQPYHYITTKVLEWASDEEPIIMNQKVQL